MLSRLRKNKDRQLQAADPAARRRAAESLSAERARELSNTLLKLAATDNDPGVRAACIAKIDDPAQLAELLGDNPSAELGAARVAELLAANQDHHPLRMHPKVLLHLLPKLDIAEATNTLQQVQDSEQLVSLCMSTRGELRERVKSMVRGSHALGLLERASRHHDKSLNRHARSALERIKQAHQSAELARARLEELVAALDRETDNVQRLIALRHELGIAQEALRTNRQALQSEGEPPREDDSALEKRIAELPPLPAQTPEPEPEAETSPDPFEPLVAQFQALEQSMQRGEPISGLTSQRQTLTDAWLQAADHRQPSAESHRVFETVSHRFQEYAAAATLAEACELPEFAPLPEQLPDEPDALAALWDQQPERQRLASRLTGTIARIAWPEWAAPSAAYQAVRQATAAMAADLERLSAHATQIRRQAEQLVSELADQVEAGNTNDASRTLTSARRMIQALPPRSNAKLNASLNQQAAKFAELRDWQTYATSPKRESLCARMREATESPLSPPDQAELIKQLRREWNQLGPASKHQDRQLAAQFNELAEQAFEPCRTYFAEQAEVRKANLASRQLICEQLRTYLDSTDWTTADMQAAQNILRAARSEWRAYHPVDRKAGKALEEEFESLQGKLHGHVKSAWDANLQTKQEIVREAEDLVEQDLPIDEKIEQAKELQTRWKAVGITPRKPDQNLWGAFRRACDAVFAERDTLRDKTNAELKQAMAQADALLIELKSSVDRATPETAERSFTREAKRRFAELRGIPQKRLESARRTLDELLTRYEALLREQAQAQRVKRLQSLKNWDAAVCEFECSKQAGGSNELEAPAPCFEARLKDPGQAPRLEELTEQAVAAEILAGVESPHDDQALRLKLQVDQLNAGMGQRQAPPDPLDLAEAWCALGPKCWGAEDAEARPRCDELRARLFAALEHALNNPSPS